MLIGSQGPPDRNDAPPPGKLPPAIGAIQPRLAPDGASLAFSYQGGIWVAPRGGGTMTLLTTGEGDDTEPAWSPDGKRIAFVRGTAVKVVEIPGGKDVPLPRTLLTAGTYGANKLEFSADGRQLLGAFRTDGQDHGLAWFDLATGAVQPLASVHAYSRFALSPDGKWIAHTSHPDQTGEQSGSDRSRQRPALAGYLAQQLRGQRTDHTVAKPARVGFARRPSRDVLDGYQSRAHAAQGRNSTVREMAPQFQAHDLRRRRHQY